MNCYQSSVQLNLVKSLRVKLVGRLSDTKLQLDEVENAEERNEGDTKSCECSRFKKASLRQYI